jgi:hypothetical protein
MTRPLRRMPSGLHRGHTVREEIERLVGGKVFTLARPGAPEDSNGGCARTKRCDDDAALGG